MSRTRAEIQAEMDAAEAEARALDRRLVALKPAVAEKHAATERLDVLRGGKQIYHGDVSVGLIGALKAELLDADLPRVPMGGGAGEWIIQDIDQRFIYVRRPGRDEQHKFWRHDGKEVSGHARLNPKKAEAAWRAVGMTPVPCRTPAIAAEDSAIRLLATLIGRELDLSGPLTVESVRQLKAKYRNDGLAQGRVEGRAAGRLEGAKAEAQLQADLTQAIAERDAAIQTASWMQAVSGLAELKLPRLPE